MNKRKTSQSQQRSFGSEERLVAALTDFLADTAANRFHVLPEHEAGFGRPDLLLFNVASSSSIDIRSLSLVNPRLAPLLSAKASCCINGFDELALATGTSRLAARSIAKNLQATGRLLVGLPGSDELRILPVCKPPFPQVVAIEVKLRDWNRGLVQAYRYRLFSSEAWVLLDHTTIRPAVKAAARFRELGVGLASFSISGELYIHVHAQNKGWTDTALAWRTQAILARVVANGRPQKLLSAFAQAAK